MALLSVSNHAKLSRLGKIQSVQSMTKNGLSPQKKNQSVSNFVKGNAINLSMNVSPEKHLRYAVQYQFRRQHLLPPSDNILSRHAPLD